jgi:hypothetical protein
MIENSSLKSMIEDYKTFETAETYVRNLGEDI